MKIAVDLRSLQSGSVSGVENYTLNLVEHLLAQDKKNTYILFYNSWGKAAALPDFHYINAETIKLNWPNKVLNLGLKTGSIKFEKLIGDFDLLFLPNLNQFNITSGKKLAITVHDLSPVVSPEYYDAKRKLWHKFLNFKQAYKRADALFAVSEWTKSDLIRVFRLPADKIKVIYPGIDHNRFNPGILESVLRETRNRYGLPGSYVLFLNTIEPRKNLTSLIRAFENLNWPGYLVIAGRCGWKYKNILKRIGQSPKKSKIQYLGYVSERDKPALIKMAKALAYPSFYEGFGFQPLEAAACGTPVISSSATSIPEIAGNFSLLVNPYDINSITTGLSAALTQAELRARLIASGYKEAKKYTWNATAKKLLTALEQFEP